MTRAFIFPGQGSQTVGMGKALADAFPQARAVFDEVDAALSQKLSSLIWDGPAEELTFTANTSRPSWPSAWRPCGSWRPRPASI